MKVASLRIHRVGTVKEAQEEYAASPDIAARNLWGWVSPAATARACLLSVTSDKLIGHESERSNLLFWLPLFQY